VKKSYFEFQELLEHRKVVATETEPISIIESRRQERDRAERNVSWRHDRGGDTASDREHSRTVINLPSSSSKPNFSKTWLSIRPDGSPGPVAAEPRPWPILLSSESQSNVLPTLLVSLLPILMLLTVVYFLFRHQMKMAGRGAMSFGKSKAKMLSMDKDQVAFKNVAGVEEAKEEVCGNRSSSSRILKKFQRLGGRIPKGVPHGWTYPGPAKPFSHGPSPEKPMCRSLPSVARTLWRCYGRRWCFPASGTCLSKERRTLPVCAVFHR